jgi:hypothetical protein
LNRYLRLIVLSVIAAAASGCATQYDSYSQISMDEMTLNEAYEYLSGLGIPYTLFSCEKAESSSSDPLASCQNQNSYAIIWALANDGSYMLGAGSSDMQLYIEVGEDRKVLEVREDVAYTFF